MQLKIEIDAEMIEQLTAQAVSEKRSIPRQAEVILRRALGLPFPRVITSDRSLKEFTRERA